MNRFHLPLLILLLISLACSESGYKSQIRRIVERRCTCFEESGILVSPPVIKVLEQGLDSPSGSDITLYHDLSDQGKQELHQLYTSIYDDSTSKLLHCLSNTGEAMSTNNLGAQDSYMDEVASSKKGCLMERFYESSALYYVKMTATSKDIFDQQCNCFDSAGIVLSEKVRKVLEEAATVPIPSTHLQQYDGLSVPEKDELKKFVSDYYEDNSPIKRCFERGQKQQIKVRDYQSTMAKNMLLEVAKNRKDCRFPYYVQSMAIYNVATSVFKKFR